MPYYAGSKFIHLVFTALEIVSLSLVFDLISVVLYSNFLYRLVA